MIIVYTEHEGSRFRFILTQVLVRILGGAYLTTTCREEYLASSHPGICYSSTNVGRGLWMCPNGLLEEEGWRAFTPRHTFLADGTPVLFPCEEEGSAPFDIFSAAFYLLTRYEEYTSQTTDAHGRYLPEASVLHAMGCMERPIVEEWAQGLQAVLEKAAGQTLFPGRKHRIVLTHDIDHPFLYRNKGFFLSLFGLIRDLVRKDYKACHTRLRTLMHRQEDPFFNFTYLIKVARENQFTPFFFVHAGPYGKYDRKYVYSSRRYPRTVQEIAQTCPVGLHPSYQSGDRAEAIGREKKRLEKWTGKKVSSSRQHFLRYAHPATAEVLLEAGIRADYSLGYSQQCGFRAGTSIPFPFFNVDTNRETPLMLHPLVAMDVTLKRDLKASPEAAKKKLLALNEVCRRAGGDFTLLIHNSSLAECDGWQGWREMYESLLQELNSE